MKNSSDTYSNVTNKIIADLEQGNLTWLQPWQSRHHTGHVSRPLRANGKPYRGINILTLWSSSIESGFNSPIWITYQQALELGGQVRKGQKGSQIVYADQFKKTETNQNGLNLETFIPFMKSYTVFNAEQVDGLPPQFSTHAEPVKYDNQRNETAELFFSSTKATIKHQGSQAFYLPSLDYIQMPELHVFRYSEGYYATLAHEITHWTGHKSRLNRNFGGKRFGDSGYAMEELVAEIGAAFLCADLGITPETRIDHAAYIVTWLKILKNDKRAIFTAASYAQFASDHLQTYQGLFESK